MYNCLFHLSLGSKSPSFWHGNSRQEKIVGNYIFINRNKTVTLFSITWHTSKIIDYHVFQISTKTK